jgi:exopolysaccharide production protein ExoZ
MQSGMRQNGATLRGVQSLRALAALAVVVFHATDRAGAAFVAGSSGVDIFFVISGFIMWVVRERGVTPLGFIKDRVLRIAPLYWIATAIIVGGGIVHLFPNLPLSPPHILASFLFIPYPYPIGGAICPILVQGWTLNYEMFFYALFAAALTLPRRWHLPVLCGVLVALSIYGALFHPDQAALHTYTNPEELEFAGGACIGELWLRKLLNGKVLGACLLVAGLALLLVPHSDVPRWSDRLILWGGPAMLVVAGMVALERAGVSLATPATMLLGNASYSIYLFHLFGVSLVTRLLGARLGFWPESVASMAVGLAAGLAAYLIVEKPIMAYIKHARKRGAARRQSAALGSEVVSPHQQR